MMSWVLRKVITLEVKGEEEIREETWGLGEGDDGDGGD